MGGEQLLVACAGGLDALIAVVDRFSAQASGAPGQCLAQRGLGQARIHAGAKGQTEQAAAVPVEHAGHVELT